MLDEDDQREQQLGDAVVGLRQVPGVERQQREREDLGTTSAAW